MNSTKPEDLSEAICSLDKMETITKVLHQTVFTDKDFNIEDYQNLCGVLLREISFTKSKITNSCR